MSSFKFEINKGGLENLFNDATKKAAAELQKVLDMVERTQSGKPASQVKPALRLACHQAGYTPDDRQLTSWATAIAAGTHIVVRPEHVRL